MSTAAHYPHIVVDAAGVARIDETRYKVLHLAAAHFYHGWTAEELLRQHTDLRPEQAYSASGLFLRPLRRLGGAAGGIGRGGRECAADARTIAG